MEKAVANNSARTWMNSNGQHTRCFRPERQRGRGQPHAQSPTYRCRRSVLTLLQTQRPSTWRRPRHHGDYWRPRLRSSRPEPQDRISVHNVTNHVTLGRPSNYIYHGHTKLTHLRTPSIGHYIRSAACRLVPCVITSSRVGKSWLNMSAPGAVLLCPCRLHTPVLRLPLRDYLRLMTRQVRQWPRILCSHRTHQHPPRPQQVTRCHAQLPPQNWSPQIYDPATPSSMLRSHCNPTVFGQEL